MELQVTARDTDIDFSPFLVKEMDCVRARVYKIRALYVLLLRVTTNGLYVWFRHLTTFRNSK